MPANYPSGIETVWQRHCDYVTPKTISYVFLFLLMPRTLIVTSLENMYG